LKTLDLPIYFKKNTVNFLQHARLTFIQYIFSPFGVLEDHELVKRKILKSPFSIFGGPG
jgi:hypothetical protein